MPPAIAASFRSKARYVSSHGGVDALVLCLFSAFYFTSRCLRASSKYFWFDELCSLYICRLPHFSDSWQAVLHGADYNPPLFYLIERGTRALFGEGLVALRLPSIAGVWIFCVSLYVVVARRAGRLCGSVALLFPLCTVVSYYACESRPHPIVLGFCGLALVTWQRSRESTWPVLWLCAFGLCLTAAVLTHCYAILIVVPFALAELWETVKRRQIRWVSVASWVLPLIIAFVAYQPLLRVYKSTLAGTGFAYMFRPGLWQLHFFYLLVFAPFIGTLAACLVVLTVAAPRWRAIQAAELLVYAGFALLPLAAVGFAAAVHGPFIARYFLASVAGFAALLGLAFEGSSRNRWGAILVIVILCMAQGRDLAGLVAHHLAGVGEGAEEPAIHIPVNDTPGKPLADYNLLLDGVDTSLPVVTAEPMDFLYLFHYGPSLASRLQYVTGSPDETNYRLYTSVRKWCHLAYNQPTTYAAFFAANRQFYVFGDDLNLQQLSELSKAGVKIASFESGPHHWLARVVAPQ